MADLDDFFAKKDRKKSKSKKFSTADELAKKLDDTKQKSDIRPKKERPIQEGDESGRIGEEDEWKEYEEPVKDYTGLKIQVLQGGVGVPDAGRDSAGEEFSSDSIKPKGPWNKSQQEQEAETPTPVEAPAPAPPAPEAKPRESKYVVPAVRKNPTEPTIRRQHPKHAPDINNSTYFPELGAGARRPGWGAPGAQPPVPAAPTGQVSMGNRFTTLQNDT